MTDSPTAPDLARPAAAAAGRLRWHALGGRAAVAGVLAAALGNLAGVIAQPDNGLVDATISDVAAGRHAWMQDLGLCLLGAGVLALAAALWRLHPLVDGNGRVRSAWGAGAAALAASGACVLVIALHDAYGDRQAGGWVIHMGLVIAYACFALLAMLLTAPGLGLAGAGWRRFGLALGALWLVSGPPLLAVPDAWSGLYERGVALVFAAWLVGVALWPAARALSPSAGRPPPRRSA